MDKNNLRTGSESLNKSLVSKNKKAYLLPYVMIKKFCLKLR